MCKELFRQDILGFGLGASIWAVGKDVLCISFQKRAYSNEKRKTDKVLVERSCVGS